MPHEHKVPLMIVEDDANIRYLLSAAAERAEVYGPITTAPDGQAALELLRQLEPSALPEVIATDLSMPRMNGIELIRALKADPALRHIPVGVITSSDQPNDRNDAFAAGACAFIWKPHSLDALIKALLVIYESCAQVGKAVAPDRDRDVA